VASRRHQHALLLAPRRCSRLSIARSSNPLQWRLQEPATQKRTQKASRLDEETSAKGSSHPAVFTSGRWSRDPRLSTGRRTSRSGAGRGKGAHARTDELPDNIRAIRSIVGDAKRKSSRTVKREMPGNVWAAGGTFKPVKDRDHALSTHDYIIYDQGDDAWTWSYVDESPDGTFGRKRPPHKLKRSRTRRARA
jgi:hypothetical protein